jgi:hypothetical protein
MTSLWVMSKYRLSAAAMPRQWRLRPDVQAVSSRPEIAGEQRMGESIMPGHMSDC